jgi:raffinose/stachyose/melibiose transport system permease protein
MKQIWQGIIMQILEKPAVLNSSQDYVEAAPVKKKPTATKQPRRPLGKRLRENWSVYLMLAPNVLMFLVFSIYPLLWALRYVFYDYDGLNEPRFIGFDNFARVFTRDEVFWQSVLNTLIFAGGKLLLTLPLALVLAVLLNGKLRANGILQAIYFMPTVMGAAVMSLVFFLIFNPYNGSLNQVLTGLKVVDRPVDWLGVGWAMFTTILVASWAGLGNYMVLFLAGLQTIPHELTEAATLDGATPRRIFFSITIPLLGPVMQVVLLLAIINALKGFESIMVLTGGGPGGQTQVMNLYVYRLFFPVAAGENFTPEYGYGAAVGMVVSLIIGLFTVVYLWSARKMDKIS